MCGLYAPHQTSNLIRGVCMIRLEDLTPNASVRGVVPDALVTVVNANWYGSAALELTYKTPEGKLGSEILYRDDEARLEMAEAGRPWSFDADGALFRLVSEAHRIHLAHLFDPVLAVHTSLIEPLPHQITAVYEVMLPRQPLRFLLADDPGAGKTIMAGLYIKELLARGDLQRCMVVCPGSLAEQWQDELYRKFNLPFEILTNDKLEAARTGNWFLETDLVIARLDKLSRDEDVQAKLQLPECQWDLVVFDEAHKLSASFFGGEIKYTKRYLLARMVSGLTRNFLLMTATPHNGKEEDFQLFMALLDGDRFEGRFRDGVHTVDVSDLMRRMVKENLLKFDGKPLFPERIAYTVPYRLSDAEAALYKAVTEYVREEFNRAEALQNNKRAGTIGFALTILQRRLASSPEAILQSLRRRRERLESRLREMQVIQRGGRTAAATNETDVNLDDEALEDLEDATEEDFATAEEQILDQATAARSVIELEAEIATLKRLEKLALEVRRSGQDTKWRELANLLHEVFAPVVDTEVAAEATPRYGAADRPEAPRSDKLVIFTEHRDTLTYLHKSITTVLGRPDAVVMIHGGMGREDRLKTQEAFRHDPGVNVLVATDAAGEGINLQRAHLMVNYDLPWNPNRIEQRFGRIHRIGQSEVCHLWNLVAGETREGDVYRRLLEKLDQARQSLGGQVFDVLGKLQFEGKPLRDLLIEAVRYGERPDVRGRLEQVVADAVDPERLKSLLDDQSLVQETMDTARVFAVREEMERAEARRLQPHYIQSFFKEAFARLGGALKQREPRRFEITHVPASIRSRDRVIGTGEPVMPRYQRITFEKELIAPHDAPAAAFVCPGHPLLDSTVDLVMERNRDLLRRGAILVDDSDESLEPRLLFYLEHAIQDGSTTRGGDRRVISKRLLYVEIDHKGDARHAHYAPYLDYRHLEDNEPPVEAILSHEKCAWIAKDLEQGALSYSIQTVVPEHTAEVRERALRLIDKTEAAVKERLAKEINYWDHRAAELKAREEAGAEKRGLNSSQARQRADELQTRLQRRLKQLALARQIVPLPPVILGGVVVLPIGLVNAMMGIKAAPRGTVDKQAVGLRAREIVMDQERSLGFDPIDREADKVGYDVESRVPGTGQLRFIEVKGRSAEAATITVTRNEVLYSLNRPDHFILAIVRFDGDGGHTLRYVRRPFGKEPDFGVTSVNYDVAELLSKSTSPA